MTATDALGHRATDDRRAGAHAGRLRAPHARARSRTGRCGGAWSSAAGCGPARGGPLRGREILVQQRLNVDGTRFRTVRTVADQHAAARFRVRLPAGGSRVVRVTSPGTGGLQARLRTLRLHVPWSSSLTVRPRRRAAAA